jgi:hypothetical protein
MKGAERLWDSGFRFRFRFKVQLLEGGEGDAPRVRRS